MDDELERARKIASDMLAEIEDKRRKQRRADLREFWEGNWSLLLALITSISLPVVQVYSAASPTAKDMASLSDATKALAVIAALLWVLAVAKGAVYVAQRLLTLPARMHTWKQAELRNVERGDLGAETVDAFRSDIAESRRQLYREERRAWLFTAGFQFMITVLLFAFWYWILGVRDTSGACELGYPSWAGSGPCDGHFGWSSLYLSMSTITLLGSGDVQPLGVSRILVGVEALTGLLYTGVFIAGLTRILENTDFED